MSLIESSSQRVNPSMYFVNPIGAYLITKGSDLEVCTFEPSPLMA